jgi:hypothetical protein
MLLLLLLLAVVMEVKRKYRRVSSNYELKLIALHRKLEGDKCPRPKVGKVIENGWFTRHFSLTGSYYHLSRYGESISRPTAIGAITLFLSTLFWATQSSPILEPHFSFLSDSTNAVVAGNSSTVASNQKGVLFWVNFSLLFVLMARSALDYYIGQGIYFPEIFRPRQ